MGTPEKGYSGNVEVSESTPKNYFIDKVVWILWLILMWGFLGVLAYTESPKNCAGIHEVIVLVYFLGFTFIFGWLYWVNLK